MSLWNIHFEHFGWVDLVDVTLLTLVCFRLYLWLRGTVALHVVAGLAVLGVASVLASTWNLLLTTYLLQAVGAVAAILVVVVFQDEIRQGLRGASALKLWQRGRSRWRQRENDPFDPLSEGVARLARKRIGAILVLPRLDKVDEHLTGGVPIDAQNSPDLLEGLFHTRSPVHDGAMVLAGGRITRGGAVLPLTTSTTLPDHFGTRHRAAVGLSEQCDALVVVVSEERGEVSLAEAGAIRTLKAEDHGAPDKEGHLAGRIATSIRQSMRNTPTPSKPLDRVSMGRRFLYGVLAFILILVGVGWAWSTLVGDRSTMVDEERAVELRALPEDHTLKLLSPKSGRVQVRLMGPRGLLDTENRQKVKVWADLESVKPGYRYVTIRVKAPAGLRVVEVSPKRLRVHVQVKKQD